MTTKKAAPRKRKPASMVYYVLSRRARLFGWDPVQVFPSMDLAVEYRNFYEQHSAYARDGYKITKVDLVNAPIEKQEILRIP